MKYYIRTFGCQMNKHDSEFIGSMLEKLGYTDTESVNEADVVVVNTCSIRDTAEKKIMGFIDSLILTKRLKPELRVIVAGCMVSGSSQVDELLKKRRHIDIVLGTRSLDKLPQYLLQLESKPGPYVDFDLDVNITEGRSHKRDDGFRGYLTIMYGCDNFCSYCVVPHVRGREKSRELQDIVAEAKAMAEDGVKEITLLGQNVNSYGKGLKSKMDFADVLYAVSEIDGIERIRYMTSHPKDFSDRIVEAIAQLPKVCRHFHLPFQSGSSRILERMNRHYTKDYYLELMEKIKKTFPNSVLTTDIIVGFPGEKEEDFQDTIDLLEKIEFDLAYTFIYSPRKGTPGADMPEQIPQSVKKQRLLTLMDIQNEISLKRNKEMIGKTYKLLGEGASRTKETVQSGRTEGNKLVHFQGKEDYCGKFVEAEITEANTWSLKGRLI
ncbi:MAG: tRNA (N6-isopentenyl adenosine(37)-C2)-methylthiotransferase MiaB [Bacillota bacterium]|nr:tRNA (N6-isopentenyl adenosine(37)-C2)-methylthiotransferase MiaB [Bacillota bacterium]